MLGDPVSSRPASRELQGLEVGQGGHLYLPLPAGCVFSETEAHLTWGAQPLMQNCSEKPSQRVRGVGLPEGAGLPEGRGFPPSLRGILRKMRLAGAVWPHLGSGWRPLCGLVWISSWSARACGSGWPFAS